MRPLAATAPETQSPHRDNKRKWGSLLKRHWLTLNIEMSGKYQNQIQFAGCFHSSLHEWILTLFHFELHKFPTVAGRSDSFLLQRVRQQYLNHDDAQRRKTKMFCEPPSLRDTETSLLLWRSTKSSLNQHGTSRKSSNPPTQKNQDSISWSHTHTTPVGYHRATVRLLRICIH